MRKLLILLSVVLSVALCQSTKRPTRKLPATHITRPLDCIFGYKKLIEQENAEQRKNSSNTQEMKQIALHLKNLNVILLKTPKLAFASENSEGLHNILLFINAHQD